MPTLYVIEPGAHIEKEYHRLVVAKEDEVIQRVPIEHVSEVVLIGAVGITPPAMVALLDAGVAFSLIRSTGQLLGRLTPPIMGNLPLRHQQYQRALDSEFCLLISKGIVAGKLRNQRTIIRRLYREHKEVNRKFADAISLSLSRITSACDLNSLRGLEGSAAKTYFKALRSILPQGWESVKRERRPPPDPFNALISFGYTLLLQNVMTALELVGMDPYDGFFHADKYGRPALSLDMMEEFRGVIVDSVVLSVINKRILHPDDFTRTTHGVMLKSHALHKFLQQYSSRLQTAVFHPYACRKLTYQKCLEV